MNSPNNISLEEWNLIETWLDQTIVPGNETLPNEKLTQIPDFAQKAAYIKKVREEIENSIRQSKIKEFHNNIPANKNNSGSVKSTNKKIKLNDVWYAIAAVLVVLFVIFRLLDNSNPSEKIFANYFKPDVGLPLKMSNNNANGFYEGMLNYKQEKYEEAIAKWEVLLKSHPESDTLNYFLGVANLALGNSDKSLEYLQNQERFQQGIFQKDAVWYAALAEVKEGKLEEAKTLLINNPSDRNQKLLKELESHSNQR